MSVDTSSVMIHFADIVTAYLESAFWTNSEEIGDDKDFDDIDPASRAAAEAQIKGFIEGCEEDRPGIFADMQPEMIGHDFWLTRNHHGAGFWDRGLGERGDYFTKMAHPFGESNVCVGDDGRVYLSE